MEKTYGRWLLYSVFEDIDRFLTKVIGETGERNPNTPG